MNAFPNVHDPKTGSMSHGMSLRDYFAAKAMQGFIQHSASKGIYAPPDNELAKMSYDLADAMLRARDET